MNIATLPKEIHSLIQANRQKRMEVLLKDEVSILPVLKTPYSFQKDILKATRNSILKGHHQGRWDIAVGGGKTVMALSIAKHVVDRGGKILFLTPGNVELDNVIQSHSEKYNLGDENYLVFSQESDIIDLSQSKRKPLYDKIGYYYSTAGMLFYDKRYLSIPFDFFDFVFIDESHSLMGDIVSGPQSYFQSTQIYMSATPYNMTRHLGNKISHKYGSISSQELIDFYGYPSWRVKNYYVEDKKNPLQIHSQDFDFEDRKQHSLLNTSKRFFILESIMEEIILSGGRKGIVYMPSICDAEIFVKYIVLSNPILKGKVDYVAGVKGDTHNEKVERSFRNGNIKIVLSKDLWSQSLDVPEVTDIILNDPSRSMQKLLQRIGRGARPSPNKEFLTIHDIVSSYYHCSDAGIPALKAENIVRQNASESKVGVYKKAKISDIDDTFLRNLEQRRDHSQITLTMNEIEHKEIIQQAFFLSDQNLALKVFSKFAFEVFLVSYKELFDNFNYYLKKSQKLKIKFREISLSISLKEAQEITEFYGTFDFCRDYDFVSEISDIVKNNLRSISCNSHPIYSIRQQTLSNIESILAHSSGGVYQDEGLAHHSKEISTFPSKENFVGRLNEKIQKLQWEINFYEVKEDIKYKGLQHGFRYKVLIKGGGEEYMFENKEYYGSKQEAKRAISFHVLKFLKERDIKNRPSLPSSGVVNIDFISRLNLFVQKFKGGGKLNFESIKSQSGYVYRISIKILQKTYEFESLGYHSDKKAAKNQVSQIALSQLEKEFTDIHIDTVTSNNSRKHEFQRIEKELRSLLKFYNAKYKYSRQVAKKVDDVDGGEKPFYKSVISISIGDKKYVVQDSGFFPDVLSSQIAVYNKAIQETNFSEDNLISEKSCGVLALLHSYLHYNNYSTKPEWIFYEFSDSNTQQLMYSCNLKLALGEKEVFVKNDELHKTQKSAKIKTAGLFLENIFGYLDAFPNQQNIEILSKYRHLNFLDNTEKKDSYSLEEILQISSKYKNKSELLKAMQMKSLIGAEVIKKFIGKEKSNFFTLEIPLFYPYKQILQSKKYFFDTKETSYAKQLDQAKSEMLQKIFDVPGITEVIDKYYI